MNRIKKSRLLRVLCYVSLPLFPVLCLFVMDDLNFRGVGVFKLFLERHPLSLVFELAVMLLIFAALLLIFRRAVIACGLLGVISFICAYVNYMKVSLNGDNFYPNDLALAGSTGELMSFISGDVPRIFWLCLGIAVVWVVLLGIMGTRLPLGWFVRLPAAAVLIAAVCVTFSSSERSEIILNKFKMSYYDAALQSSNYASNGFVGAFTVNILSSNVSQPDGYSERGIVELMSDLSETPTADNAEEFDVIVVLSESFFDVRRLPGVSFSQNPLPNYDDITAREGCMSGMLYTTAVFGGTVKPEFEILTGLSTDDLPDGASPYVHVSSDIETYVSNYKSSGYRTIALHPYDEKFYSRSYAYGYLGFDVLHGFSDISSVVDVSSKRGYVTDESTLAAMKYYLGESTEPAFLFAITMENHQPYNALPDEDIGITVSSDALSETALTAVTTYTQGLSDADAMLGELADYIDGRDRPTVLVFFGDHLPTLGADYLAYRESGMISEGESGTERQKKIYSTPFVIYSNRELSSSMLEAGGGNEISTYNLLNAVAEMTGFHSTRYMNALRDFYSVTPYYNERLYMDMTDEISRYADMMRYVTYDRLFGGEWSADKGGY